MGSNNVGTGFTALVASGSYNGITGSLALTQTTNSQGSSPRAVVILQIQGKPASGASYTTTLGAQGALTNGQGGVFYSEGSGSCGTSMKTWKSTGGSMTVDSISGSTVTYKLTNVPMGPNDQSPGAGTFSLSGTCAADVAGL